MAHSDETPETPAAGVNAPMEAPAATAPPQTSPDAEPEAPEAGSGARPRWRAAAREVSLIGIILLGFVLTASTVLSPRVIPFNGDEVDTFFTFTPREIMSHDRPWLMTASHSGMYNLAFWIRSFLAGSPDAILNAGMVNRAFNVGIAAALFLALYGFGRWLLDARFGLILMFTAAFAHMTLFITIEGNYLNETSLAILISAWAYLAGERSSSLWLKFVFGLACGAMALVSGLLYFSGRMILPALACHGALMQMQNRNWIRRSAPLLLGISAFAGPGAARFVQDQKSHPEQASYRQRGTQILYRGAIDAVMTRYNTDSVAAAVAKNAASAFKGYAVGPNTYHAYLTPQGYLDKFSFALGVMGLGWAVFRWRRPEWLLLLIMFAVNNAVLGGLTFLPYPPYHQRVHFGILLGYIFVSLPVWAAARAPGRWSRPGQAAAGAALIAIGLWNCHLYFSRVFNPNDYYMRSQGLIQEVSDYVIPLTAEHDLFMTYCAQLPNPDLYHPLYHHNVGYLYPGRTLMRVSDYIEYAKPDFKRTLGSKPPLFMFLRGDGPCPMAQIEAGLPGGRWVHFSEWGRPYLDVYVPPRGKPAA